MILVVCLVYFKNVKVPYANEVFHNAQAPIWIYKVELIEHAGNMQIKFQFLVEFSEKKALHESSLHWGATELLQTLLYFDYCRL